MDDLTRQRLLIGLARARARKFANRVRAVNLALPLPEEWASFSDEEIQQIKAELQKMPGMVQRKDFLWEFDSSKL